MFDISVNYSSKSIVDTPNYLGTGLGCRIPGTYLKKALSIRYYV